MVFVDVSRRCRPSSFWRRTLGHKTCSSMIFARRSRSHFTIITYKRLIFRRETYLVTLCVIWNAVLLSYEQHKQISYISLSSTFSNCNCHLSFGYLHSFVTHRRNRLNYRTASIRCSVSHTAPNWVLSPVHTSNNVEATLSNATSLTILSTMSNVASTLLLVWTGPYVR